MSERASKNRISQAVKGLTFALCFSKKSRVSICPSEHDPRGGKTWGESRSSCFSHHQIARTTLIFVIRMLLNECSAQVPVLLCSCRSNPRSMSGTTAACLYKVCMYLSQQCGYYHQQSSASLLSKNKGVQKARGRELQRIYTWCWWSNTFPFGLLTSNNGTHSIPRPCHSRDAHASDLTILTDWPKHGRKTAVSVLTTCNVHTCSMATPKLAACVGPRQLFCCAVVTRRSTLLKHCQLCDMHCCTG